MWIYIGGVAALLCVVLFFLFKGKSSSAERPDFAAGGGMTSAAGAGAGAGASDGAEENANATPITLFFGSQTGTAEGFAKALAAESKRAGFKPKLFDLEDFEVEDFVAMAENGELVAFMMATYGEGEPTDNSAAFYQWLTGKGDEEPEEGCLAGLRFTVFGLGNRQYEFYNKMGRVTKKRLLALGAEEVYKFGEGDDDGTLDEDFEEWKEDLWETLQEAAGMSASGGGESSAIQPLQELEWDVDYCQGVPTRAEITQGRKSVDASKVALSSRYYFTSEPARVLVNRELRAGGEGSTRHIEVDLRGTSLKYGTADNLGICPENDPARVDALVSQLGYDPDAYFNLQRADTEAGRSAKPIFPTPCSVRQALARYCDLNGHARKDLLFQLVHFAEDDAEKAKLIHLTSKAGKADFQAFVTHPKRSVFEVLEAFPSCRPPLERLLQMVPRLQPRLYTICSSKLVHSDRVHAVVSIVNETLPGPPEREFKGVCSNYMLRASPAESESKSAISGPTMMVHVRESTFKLPKDPSVPIVMVGPGTGVAPMRAFCQERRYWKEQGRKVGRSVLFFGCRRRDEDFIYRDEFVDFVSDGSLSSLELAFSRENPDGTKVYVQDKLAEQAELVWEIVSEGKGHFYVCGGTHMGNDVQAALEKIASTKLGSEAQGKAFVKKMRDSGKYVAELWS